VKYTAEADRILWGAVSRAVRTPTRFDRELRVRVGDLVVIQGNPEFKPEHLTAYETGARFAARSNMSFEASWFYNDYDDLRSQEATPLITLDNLYDGYTTGVELAGNVQPHPQWLVHAGYTGQRVALAPLPGSHDTTNARLEADDPAHMFSARSYLNLPHGFELDAFFRAVSALRASKLPGYQELDARFGWQMNDRLDVSLVGRDLLHARHAEFLGASAQPRHFQREVALRVTWQSR
jgi:iron complex outermembrane receptor protein